MSENVQNMHFRMRSYPPRPLFVYQVYMSLQGTNVPGLHILRRIQKIAKDILVSLYLFRSALLILAWYCLQCDCDAVGSRALSVTVL